MPNVPLILAKGGNIWTVIFVSHKTVSPLGNPLRLQLNWSKLRDGQRSLPAAHMKSGGEVTLKGSAVSIPTNLCFKPGACSPCVPLTFLLWFPPTYNVYWAQSGTTRLNKTHPRLQEWLGWCRRQVDKGETVHSPRTVARAVRWALKTTFRAQGKDRTQRGRVSGRQQAFWKRWS